MNQLLLENFQEIKVSPKKKFKLLSWIISFYFSYLTIQCLFKTNFSDIWFLIQFIFIEDKNSDFFLGKFFAFLDNFERSGKVNKIRERVETQSLGGKFLLDKTKSLGFNLDLNERKFSLYFPTFIFVLWVIISAIFYYPVSWLVGKLLN